MARNQPSSTAPDSSPVSRKQLIELLNELRVALPGVQVVIGPEQVSRAVAPLREINTSLSQRPAAVLFVSDPDRNSELPCDLLRSCYGLTPAEGRLAMVLMDGHSLKEAADSCRRSFTL